MQTGSGAAATAQVVARIEAAGLGAYVFHGQERNVIAVLGTDEDPAFRDELAALPGVERVDWTTRPFKLASREVQPNGSTVPLGGGVSARLGDGLAVVAGTARPQPAESLVALGGAARDAGAHAIRVGRGEAGEHRRDLVSALDRLRAEIALPVLVDVWEPAEVERLSRHADALLVTSPQMQNVPLLKELGRGDRPVVLCRGLSATIDEWLMAAERVLQGGNLAVALCEQGIRTFEPSVRATLDFSAIAMAKRLSHLPVLANPSQAVGNHELVPELSLAAVAAGCDGLILDVRPGAAPDPSSGLQPMPLDALASLIAKLDQTRAALLG